MQRYKTWIKQFVGSDSPIGDLAEDIKNDKEFPAKDKKDELLSYLESKGACDEAIQIFYYSWELYLDYASIYRDPYKFKERYINKEKLMLYFIIGNNTRKKDYLVGIVDNIRDLHIVLDELDLDATKLTDVYIVPYDKINNYKINNNYMISWIKDNAIEDKELKHFLDVVFDNNDN